MLPQATGARRITATHVLPHTLTPCTGKCPESINRTMFGVDENSITDVFNDLELRFDMRSVSIALAVNMGQIDIAELSRVALVGKFDWTPEGKWPSLPSETTTPSMTPS